MSEQYPDNTYAVCPEWIIDGSGLSILKDSYVLIADTRIQQVGRLSDLPQTVRRIDLPGRTLIPGLIDAHVHLHMSGNADPAIRSKQLRLNASEAQEVITEHVDMQLRSGVVAIRDGGDPGYNGNSFVIDFKEQYPDCGLEIKTPGQALKASGRYGRIIGHSVVKGQNLAQAVMSKDSRIDHVKIIQSGINSLTEFGKQTSPQFSLSELSEACSQAHKMGLKVMAHANGQIPVEMAIRAGCDSIEHGFFMGEKNLRVLAEKNIVWVPTVGTMKALADTLPAYDKKAYIAMKILEHQLGQISKAIDLGVQIIAGTDCGSLGVNHGSAIEQELELLSSAGLSTEKAIAAAALNASELLDLNDDFGKIAAGYYATMIAVKSEPAACLKKMANSDYIWNKGKAVKKIKQQ